MSVAAVLPNTFSQRLGAIMQRQRQRHHLTQAALAERADISLKYLGEIERGEANVTLLTLERLATVLGWDPWRMFASYQQPISQQVHQLLVNDLGSARQRLDTVLAWLTALDPALREPALATDDDGAAELPDEPQRASQPPQGNDLRRAREVDSTGRSVSSDADARRRKEGRDDA